MKKLLLLLFIPLLISIGKQDETPQPLLENYNGWEMLEWTWSKIQVEKKLVELNIQFDPGKPNQKQGPTTVFEYLGFNTRLAYDSGHLYDVQQSRNYSAENAEEALSFLDKTIAHYNINYGESSCKKDPENQNRKRINWKTQHTRVALYYEYQPEVIEGFEDSVHIIYIQINELKD